MSEVTRPVTVPGNAEFVVEWNEWVMGPHDAEGRRTGLWRSWRKDGSYAEEAMFEAGALHGLKKRFYEDGSVASEAHHENGKAVTLECFRPAGQTSEPHTFGNLDKKVQRCLFKFAADGSGYIRQQALFTESGVEVSTHGIEAPPRPAGLPSHATFMTVPASQSVYMTASSGNGDVRRKVTDIPARQYWEAGEFSTVNGKTVQRGVTLTFALEGALERISFGESWVRVAPAATRDDKLGAGNPLIAAAKAGDDASVDLLFTLGLQQSPGADLHAAIEGLPELAQRIRSDTSPPLFQDRRETLRPEDATATAVWVPGLNAFVDGTLTQDGKAEGLFRIWKDPKKTITHTQIVFEQGYRVRQIDAGERRGKWCEDEQEFFTSGPHAGQVRIRRKFVDQVIDTETESWPDQGKTAERVFENGKKKAERIEKEGSLEVETWWKDDVRVAVIVPGDGKTQAGQSGHEVFAAKLRGQQVAEDAELYRGYDGDTLVAEGLVEGGLDGGPLGTWNVYENGQVVGEAPFTKLEGLRMSRIDRRDAGAFAQKLLRWINTPTPSWLEDIAGLEWDKLEGGWFSRGKGRLVPFLLTGLGLGDADIFDLAIGQLSNDVLHQGTLSDVTGPVLTALLRLVPEADARSQEKLLGFLDDVIGDCGGKLIHIPAVGGGDLLRLIARAPLDAIAAQAGNPDVAELATRIGTWAKERVAEIQGSLEALSAEQDPRKRFEKLFEVRRSLTPADFEVIFNDPDPIVRYWAAHFSDAAKNPRAVDIWRDTLRHVAELEPRFRKTEQGQPGLAAYLASNLANVTERHPQVRDDLPLVTATLRTVPPGSLPFFIGQILGLAFGQCELPFASHFMALLEELAVSKVLVEQAWPGVTDYDAGDVDLHAVADAFKKFGLPSTQQALEELIAMLRAAPAADEALRTFMHR